MNNVSDSDNYSDAGNRVYKQEEVPEIKTNEKNTNMTDMTSEEKKKDVSFAYLWYSLFDCSIF